MLSAFSRLFNHFILYEPNEGRGQTSYEGLETGIRPEPSPTYRKLVFPVQCFQELVGVSRDWHPVHDGTIFCCERPDHLDTKRVFLPFDASAYSLGRLSFS